MELIQTKLPFEGVMSSLIGGRKENQDTCGYTDTPRGLLLVVCDGMGGGPAGKTASVIATSVIIDFVKNAGNDIDALREKYPSFFEERQTELSITNPAEEGEETPYEVEQRVKKPLLLNPNYSDSQLLDTAIKAANREMRYQIFANPALEGMGTTVAALLINKEQATIAHVGDSRIYQIRDKKIIFRTNDHSRVGEMVRAGAITEEQARLSAYSNIITRALGVDEEVDVEIDVRPFEKGDRFILCTDGVWGAKAQNQMLKLFVNNPKSLQGTMDVLNLEVEKAGKEKGGKHDNFSAIILETDINSILKEKMSKKVKYLIYALGGLCCLSLIANIVLAIVLGHKSRDLKAEQKEEAAIEQVEAQKEEPKQEPQSQVGTEELVNNDVNSSASQASPKSPTVSTTQTGEVKPTTTVETDGSEDLEQEVKEPQQENAKQQLKEIIAEIEKVGDMAKGGEKNKKIDYIAEELKNIKQFFSDSDQEIIDNQVRELKKDKTKRAPDQSKGQCNAIVKSLSSIIKS